MASITQIKNLRRILEGQRFADFYSDSGRLGKSITGEYVRGSRDEAENEQEVERILGDIVDSVNKG